MTAAGRANRYHMPTDEWLTSVRGFPAAAQRAMTAAEAVADEAITA